MSNYTGYRCPVCGKAFAQGDDVVVCPDCGAPHHRECYRSLGRCAYEEKHAAGEAWSPATAAGEEDGTFVTAGGRVLGVTATGETLAGAIQGAYAAAREIKFPQRQFRQDIGRRALSALPPRMCCPLFHIAKTSNCDLVQFSYKLCRNRYILNIVLNISHCVLNILNLFYLFHRGMLRRIIYFCVLHIIHYSSVITLYSTGPNTLQHLEDTSYLIEYKRIGHTNEFLVT